MARTLPRACVLLALLAAAPTLASEVRAPSPPPWAAGESRGEDLRISLITFGPGSEVASLFGHSALLVEDTRHLQSRVYNYGMFSFDRTLLMRYALGKLTFWLGESSLERTLGIYRRQGREILVQELLFDAKARADVAGYLAWNAEPANRGYLYDHFLDNCATRPRDVIDRFASGRLHRQMDRPSRMSLRDHVRRYTEVQPAVGLLFDFLMNSDVERPITVWDEAFLPAVLAAEVEAAGIAAPSRLVATAVERPPIAEQPPRLAGWLFVAGALAGALAVLLAQRASRRTAFRRLFAVHQLLVGLTIGVPGLVLALLWLITEHKVAFANENLLLANPLTLMAAPLGAVLLVKPSARVAALLEVIWLSLAFTSAFALVAKVLPLFDQDNAPLLALAVPLNLGCALAARRLRRSGEPPAA